MDTGLTGKTALITGAASGIGYTTVLAFAREGAHLALIDRDKAKLSQLADELRKHGIRVTTAVVTRIPCFRNSSASCESFALSRSINARCAPSLAKASTVV